MATENTGELPNLSKSWRQRGGASITLWRRQVLISAAHSWWTVHQLCAAEIGPGAESRMASRSDIISIATEE
jgi:hypothetical protein